MLWGGGIYLPPLVNPTTHHNFKNNLKDNIRDNIKNSIKDKYKIECITKTSLIWWVVTSL